MVGRWVGAISGNWQRIWSESADAGDLQVECRSGRAGRELLSKMPDCRGAEVRMLGSDGLTDVWLEGTPVNREGKTLGPTDPAIMSCQGQETRGNSAVRVQLRLPLASASKNARIERSAHARHQSSDWIRLQRQGRFVMRFSRVN